MHFAGPSLVAVATGIVGSAWTSGAIVSFSVAAAPAAKAVPQTTAQVWSELYARGANLMPKVATVFVLSYAYAAYDVRERGGPWLGFVAAAASVLTIVPFTLTVMKTTNAALESAPADRARVSGLIDTWAGLNSMRGLFPLVGTILGIKAF